MTKSRRLGIDIGGTFTDFCLFDPGEPMRLWKESSTPSDPLAAVIAGIEAMAAAEKSSPAQFLSEIDGFVHGSTIATNAVIQRDGGPVGLLCTQGFRDVLYFRDGYKPERFNHQLIRPEDFVERHLRIGVEERVDRDGTVVRDLDAEGVRAAAATFREKKVTAVAVAFLWSIVNPGHELEALRILEEELPGVPVVASHRVLPEIREWERTSATVLSAYVLPKIGDYLQRLESYLTERGLPVPAQYMQINGGCARIDEIMKRPVNILGSGPAAAAAASIQTAGRVSALPNARNLITIDMGGTSLDLSVIEDGRPIMTRDLRVEAQPVGVSGVEVQSIGAGGGSIAYLDTGGVLKVGPISAGSVPGPACYGAGGERPTVTDANVVLGYVVPETFLGGRRGLHEELSRKAIASHIADPLGISVEAAAAGILEVVDANMVRGIRTVSVERGIDPRNCTLVTAGGAGGLHSARLARALGIGHVLVPSEAATYCAFGMTVTDVRHDYTFPYPALSIGLDVEQLDSRFKELESIARERLLADGFTADQIRIDRQVDARYPNQLHDITVAIPSPGHYSDEDLRVLEGLFHAEHERRYTYSMSELPVEFVHWRVSAYGIAPVPEQAPGSLGSTAGTNMPAAPSSRLVHHLGVDGRLETQTYRASELTPGTDVSGPAIVESDLTTTLVGPTDRLVVTPDGSLLIQVGRAERHAP